ncbi:hypothetical protein B4Q13_22880, partial [Lacticaseibacillus rhamnosus]
TGQCPLARIGDPTLLVARFGGNRDRRGVPTLLGALFPGVEDALFPTDIITPLGVVANLGLIFYMFLVGLELDLRQLKGRISQAAAISNAGVFVPLTMGFLIAIPAAVIERRLQDAGGEV